jgi:hypothetical protein
VYAWKNEQGNVASEPRFPETSVKSLTNVSLTKVAPKFCKVLEEKRRLVDARFAIEQRAHSIA